MPALAGFWMHRFCFENEQKYPNSLFWGNNQTPSLRLGKTELFPSRLRMSENKYFIKPDREIPKHWTRTHTKRFPELLGLGRGHSASPQPRKHLPGVKVSFGLRDVQRNMAGTHDSSISVCGTKGFLRRNHIQDLIRGWHGVPRLAPTRHWLRSSD
mmetsp:Transcript_48495/g.56676  ORF Transcript_48495/g.56676 Transcript_48495/m.56676 type:complete len:156 (+) Transcript_48495:1736-2203(+)